MTNIIAPRAPEAVQAPAADQSGINIDQLIRSIKKSFIGDSATPTAVDAPQRQAVSRPTSQDLPILEVDSNREFQRGLSVNLRARLRLPASGPRQAKLCVRGRGYDGDTLGLDFCRPRLELQASRTQEITVPWLPGDSAPLGENLVTWELFYNGVRYEGISKHDIMPDPASDQPPPPPRPSQPRHQSKSGPCRRQHQYRRRYLQQHHQRHSR